MIMVIIYENIYMPQKFKFKLNLNSQEKMFPTSNECIATCSVSNTYVRVILKLYKIEVVGKKVQEYSLLRFSEKPIEMLDILKPSNIQTNIINLPFIYSPWFYHNGNIQRQPRSSVTIKYFLVTMKIIDPQQHNTAIIGTAAT